jgi:Rod binding domain-containing protein
MNSVTLPAGVAPPPTSSPAPAAPAHAPPAGAKPEVARAAREFEAIFLRQILTSLEKSGHMGGTASTGSDVYGSMMVGALADAVANAGGVGLAKYVTTSLAHTPAATPAPTTGGAGLPLQKPKPIPIQTPSKTSQKGIP